MRHPVELERCTALNKTEFFIGVILFTLFMAPQSGSANTTVIPSGGFDMNLMIAIDEQTQRVTGYFNSRGCRFYFAGNLAEAYQSMYGSTLLVTSWQPGKKEALSNIEIYSVAKESFQQQITLHTRSGQVLPTCFSRISLDRAYNVNHFYTGVRVVKKRHAKLFDFKGTGDAMRFLRITKFTPPKMNAGVWEQKIYGSSYIKPGYVSVAWYEDDGTPRGAYIRERDLYPKELDEHKESTGVNDGIF